MKDITLIVYRRPRLACNPAVGFSVPPKHLSDHNCDHDYSFKLPLARERDAHSCGRRSTARHVRYRAAPRTNRPPTNANTHSHRRKDAMKTAGRENQNRYATILVAFRASGTEGENNPAQLTRLDVKKKSGRGRRVFFLTPFIELIRTWDIVWLRATFLT